MISLTVWISKDQVIERIINKRTCTEIMRIIGIDPGYAITGWGLIENKPDLKVIEYGAVSTDAGIPPAKRLLFLYNEINEVLETFKPDAAVIESLFFSTNKKTASGVFQARGVLLLALENYGCRILEIPPVTIKQSVTGSGKAKKDEVLRMVMRLLKIENKISPDDISDALAGAIAGAFHLSSEAYYAAVKGAK